MGDGLEDSRSTLITNWGRGWRRILAMGKVVTTQRHTEPPDDSTIDMIDRVRLIHNK